MPVATSYTETEIATFMHDTIGDEVAGLLQWSAPDADPGDYQRAVNAALRIAGLADITDADDMEALEAAALLALMRAGEMRTLHLINTSTDGQSVNLREAHENFKAMIPAARREAMRHGLEGYGMSSTTIDYSNDGYAAFEDPTT